MFGRKVTKKELEKLVKAKKEYLKTKDKNLLAEINNYIDNVINKDPDYFSKLSSYNLPKEDLDYLV